MSNNNTFQIFKPLIDGTLQTLKVQCSVEATLGKPFIKGKGTQNEIQIAAIIGLTSSTFTGTMTISFPEKVFLFVMNSMLGENFTEITSDLHDGVGELLNISFGQGKKVLNESGHNLQMALPMILSGAKLKSDSLSKSPTMVLPIITREGEFYLEVCAELEKVNSNVA